MVGIIYSQETRNLFFKLYNIKVPIKTISFYLEISIRTLYRWIIQGVVKPINPTRIINNNKYRHLFLFINSKISENNTITLKNLKLQIYNNFNLFISSSTIYRILKNLNITFKKGSKFYIESDINKQKLFLDNIKTLDKNSIIALDEACFFLNESRNYGRSFKGTKAIIKRRGIRGKASSLILCISTNGVIKWSLYNNPISAVIIRNFINCINKPNSTLILDNSRIHHASTSLKKEGLLSINETALVKNINLHYLPPYSPYLNPVEFCFNIIRLFVSKESPKTFTDLKIIIGKAISTLTTDICNSIISKVLYKNKK